MRIGVPALIGVISDTHSSLDPRVLDVFDGVDAIVHAGDVGSPSILMELETVAPVLAVRGNTDEARWAEELPLSADLSVGAHRIVVMHARHTLQPDADVVITGHTHRPLIERLGRRLHVNPGSASSPRGPGARPTVALLDAGEHEISARVLEL